jgi:hypothetical protein
LNNLIGTRTRDFPGCSIVPQPTMLPCATMMTQSREYLNVFEQVSDHCICYFYMSLALLMRIFLLPPFWCRAYKYQTEFMVSSQRGYTFRHNYGSTTRSSCVSGCFACGVLNGALVSGCRLISGWVCN